MRTAPPLVLELGAWPAMQATVATLCALMAAGWAAWAVDHGVSARLVVWLVPVGALSAWHLSRARPRRLRWDGQAWWLADAGASDERRVELTVLIDLDAVLVLRTQPPTVWLTLAMRQSPSHWGAFRATLFSARPREPGG